MDDQTDDQITRRRVGDAMRAVLSDDHNDELGRAALRDLVDRVARQDGAAGLGDLTVALSLELADALDRIARSEGRAPAELAKTWFAD